MHLLMFCLPRATNCECLDETGCFRGNVTLLFHVSIKKKYFRKIKLLYLKRVIKYNYFKEKIMSIKRIKVKKLDENELT